MRDAGPALSDDIVPGDLDPAARRDLRGLQKETADLVARHLVAAIQAIEDDPQLALQHARFARQRASRIAVVREAAGIAAYQAGEWAEALSDLRAARRMGGGPGHLAVMADIERALGRPERAIEIARGPEAKELETAESIELTIVLAGARRDLGELDAAVVTLQIPELDPTRRDPWSPRLFYAYADNLLAAGRESDALQWFVHTVDADPHEETDAADRLAELTGEPRAGSDVDFLPDVDDVLGTDTDAGSGDSADDDAVDAADDDIEAVDDAAEDADAEDDDAEDDDAEDDDAEDDDAEDDEAVVDVPTDAVDGADDADAAADSADDAAADPEEGDADDVSVDAAAEEPIATDTASESDSADDSADPEPTR